MTKRTPATVLAGLLIAGVPALLHEEAAASVPHDDACRADINGDGIVEVHDLIFVIGDWGFCFSDEDACQSDVTLDGSVDVDDLIWVLVNWGATCEDDAE